MDSSSPTPTWVLIAEKIPTDPSPPQGSIFYATPWPISRKRLAPYRDKDLRKENHRAIRRAWNQHSNESPVGPSVFEEPVRGVAPNYKGARSLFYQGERIRVFPHEYRKVGSESLEEYAGASHDFQTSAEADKRVIRHLQKQVEYMRSRGIPESLAIVWALRGIGEKEEVEIPAIGHWRMHPEYRIELGLY